MFENIVELLLEAKNNLEDAKYRLEEMDGEETAEQIIAIGELKNIVAQLDRLVEYLSE